MNENKNKRDAKILWAKNGNGYATTRITLPVPWVRELGFTVDNKEAILELKDNEIIIRKK